MTRERGAVFFWLLLLLFVATTVVGALLAPHPQGPQPSALGDFSVPTAEEGRAIPIVFGTCMIKGGNTVWWGDLSSKAIKVGGGILSFGKTTITGYNYFLGCQFMLCHGPVDALVDIQADVKSVTRTTAQILNGDGTENYIQVNTNAPSLFGGTVAGGGGGISGIINFYRGLQTQQPDAYLSAKQGRIVTDQSGVGYLFAGTGNGTITALSAGSSTIDETITITCTGIDGNNTHSTYEKASFSVVGSRSGAQVNVGNNPDGSNTCWADAAFSCPIINLTIQTGSAQFAPGDEFTISTQQSHLASAYRGLCYAVFNHLYQGTSPYLKPIAFVVRRCPDPFTQGSLIANISGDANGALAVYDVLTSVDYGLGIPPGKINAGSFTSAATTLANEGLGLSMMFDTQDTADKLIGEILRHIDGLLHTDPATGLWTITLARGGYDPTTLPTLTVDSILATPDFARGSWEETTNKVAIRFTSRTNNFNTRIVTAYDAANVAVTNEVRPQTIDFLGIGAEAAANLVAIRVLKTLAYPLAKIKIIANRSAWQFRPGGLSRFTWVPLGVVNQVFRITRIGYGELADGKISIDAVEDIFGINSVAFVIPPISGWINPTGLPIADTADQLVEAPLDVTFTSSIPSGIYAMAMGARNLATAAKLFQVWLDEGNGFYESNDGVPMCPLGFLVAAYKGNTAAQDTTGFSLTAASVDLLLLASTDNPNLQNGTNLALIDGEIISWQTITPNSDGTFTITGILRGVMDTVPADHAAGAKVWFFSEGFGRTKAIPYPVDLAVSAKFLPSNSAGTLALASATAVGLTTVSRWKSPYPPGNLRLQGAAYGVRFTTIVGPLALTWSCRNSASAGARPLIHQDAGDQAVPPGVTYEVRTIIGGSPVGSPTNTGTTEAATITGAARAALGGAGDAPLTVQVFALLAGSPNLYSIQPQVETVIFTGFGMTFGKYYGGIQQ